MRRTPTPPSTPIVSVQRDTHVDDTETLDDLSERLDVPSLREVSRARASRLRSMLREASAALATSDTSHEAAETRMQIIDAMWRVQFGHKPTREARMQLLYLVDLAATRLRDSSPPDRAKVIRGIIASWHECYPDLVSRLTPVDASTALDHWVRRGGPAKPTKWEWLSDWLHRAGLGKVSPDSLRSDWKARKAGRPLG